MDRHQAERATLLISGNPTAALQRAVGTLDFRVREHSSEMFAPSWDSAGVKQVREKGLLSVTVFQKGTHGQISEKWTPEFCCSQNSQALEGLCTCELCQRKVKRSAEK